MFPDNVHRFASAFAKASQRQFPSQTVFELDCGFEENEIGLQNLTDDVATLGEYGSPFGWSPASELIKAWRQWTLSRHLGQSEHAGSVSDKPVIRPLAPYARGAWQPSTDNNAAAAVRYDSIAGFVMDT
jgi:hypothetical protein